MKYLPLLALLLSACSIDRAERRLNAATEAVSAIAEEGSDAAWTAHMRFLAFHVKQGQRARARTCRFPFTTLRRKAAESPDWRDMIERDCGLKILDAVAE